MIELIETVRIRDGRAPLWPLHRDRLRNSAALLGVPLPPVLDPDGGPDRIRRLTVSAAGSSWTDRAVGPTAPIRLAISPIRHPGYQHKTSDREALDAARADARASGADDVLLLTPRGEVAEGAIWTVFWWDGARLATPALGLGILPGVARRRLGELAGGLAEREVPPEALKGRPMFVANAARGVVAVRELEGSRVPADPRTGALATAFWP